MVVHLGMSGGATKAGAIFGAAKAAIDNGYKPNVISGVSSGAILALPLALGKFEEIYDIVTNLTIDDVFDQPPVNTRGKITLRAALNVVMGKHYLGQQNRVLDLVKTVVSPSEYYAWQKNSDTPEIVIAAVNFSTGGRTHFHLKRDGLDYEHYLKAVMASSSIPVFVKSVQAFGGYYFDGGVRDHIATAYALENFKVTHSISIYSRPKDYKLKDLNYNPNDHGVLSVLSRAIDIMNIEISKNDEAEEDRLCELRRINQLKIFTPSVMESLYDTDRSRLIKSYESGVNAYYSAIPTINNFDVT